MKISVLQHAPATHLPAQRGDPNPVSRNLNPLMHPFARARERTRALNAAKMERMFARPFVASLEGHIDAVEALARRPSSLTDVASGSWDGSIIVHDLPQRTQLLRLPGAHKGRVAGLCFAEGARLLSCGVDRTVKLWDTRTASDADGRRDGDAGPSEGRKPLHVYPGKAAFNAIDHHRAAPLFATASNIVQIWDETKSMPVSNLTFPTSVETVTSVRFNLSETSILASVGTDRTFTLYDIRTGKAERRVVMQMRANALDWSPTFPTTVLLASEDHNLYTFDVRHLAAPRSMHAAHAAAVAACAWSPTGTEFVSGGWDRTLRVWRADAGMEGGGRPDAYHTARMQRVTAVLYTGDARFVLSGSDDGNVRLWKARPAARLGVVGVRERAALDYRAALRARWRHDPGVAAVERSRRLPRPVHKAQQLKHTMLEARRVKEERRRTHSRAGESKPLAAKKRVVIAEQS